MLGTRADSTRGWMSHRIGGRRGLMELSVINWDGRRVPDELRKLPPGQYTIAPVDQSPSLTDDEEAGVRAGLDELDAGRGIPLADVIREIRGNAPRR